MALWKLNCRPRKILLCRYLAKVRWLKIHPPMLSDQACTPRKAGHFAPVLWGVGHDRSEGLNRHIEYKHQHTIHIISLPCLNWGDSSKVCMDTSVVFPSATAPSWYTDLLGKWRWGSLKGVFALKWAVKFRAFLCSWHRIKGFRSPKCMETSWKRNSCSNGTPGRCSSGNPPDAFHDSTHPRYSLENDWT